MDSGNYISREAVRSEKRRLLGRAYVPEAGSPAARMASQRGEPLTGAALLSGGRVLGLTLAGPGRPRPFTLNVGQRRGSGVGIATGGAGVGGETSFRGCTVITLGPT